MGSNCRAAHVAREHGREQPAASAPTAAGGGEQGKNRSLAGEVRGPACSGVTRHLVAVK